MVILQVHVIFFALTIDHGCHPVTLETSYIVLIHLHIYCLMFADDSLLLSESSEGLQKSCDKLREYCKKKKKATLKKCE